MDKNSSDEENVSNAAKQRILPERSREVYLEKYGDFNRWRLLHNLEDHSERVLLAYFKELAETKAPSSLWSLYSMLKAVMIMKHEIDIGNYRKLLAYLKRIKVGYKPKKSKVFTAAEVEKFLNEAPDNLYLPIKVALIIGISGACSTKELANLTVNDIEKLSVGLLLVKIPEVNTKKARSFVINKEHANIVESYMKLRQKIKETDRFLLQYRDGKCINQGMAGRRINTLPQVIATYLKLKDAKLYGRGCLKDTSRTLYDYDGAALLALRQGRWKVTNEEESFTEDSIEKKIYISQDIVCSRKRSNMSEPTSISTSLDKSPSPESVKKRSKKDDVCHSNAILSGLIDYYCLVCQDLFQDIKDVYQHVNTPNHNNLLEQTCYVKEYTEHRIRKLKKGYFCEYCNEAFTTSSKMYSHVDSEIHVYRRNSKQFSSSRSVLNLSWSGNRVLTSQLLIDERPWNGILDDDTCLVCDEEIDSLDDHKRILRHVLNLAQTKIFVGKDELSRKINISLYHCLICNMKCPAKEYDNHNTTESHTKNCTKVLQSTRVSTLDNGNHYEMILDEYDGTIELI